MKRGVEHLLVTQILRDLDLSMPLDEAVVGQALTPYFPPPVKNPDFASQVMGVLATTATVVVIGHEDRPLFQELVAGVTGEAWDDLPPLPYPRLWIEFGPDPELTSSPKFANFVTEDLAIHGYALTGTDAGWSLISMVSDAEWDEDGEALNKDVWAYKIEPGGKLYGAKGVIEPESAGAIFGWIPIVLVHMIGMAGAREEQVHVPRPHRRSHERRYGVAHPSVRFLRLGGTGDRKPSTGTHPGFIHRWMVMGHWQTLAPGAHPSGLTKSGREQRQRPHPEEPWKTQVWIESYAKGPQGAPWIGKTIYTTGPVA